MMQKQTVFIILGLVAAAILLVLYLSKKKPSSMTCKCESTAEAIEEGYAMGLVDGINAADNDDDKTETFYDYEYQEGSKKYQERTGSKFVRKIGGRCPPRTKEVTYGKWKGKCQRSNSWYQMYRGKDSTGKTFTCVGGRVAQGGFCVCDGAMGKVWNGSKCVCNKAQGLKWNSRTRQCERK